MPYAEIASAATRQRKPAEATATTSGLGLGRELRRALRDERVRLPLEGRALLADVDHDLAPLAEGVGDLTDIADLDGRATALPVLDRERVDRTLVLPAALRHAAGQLVGLAGLGVGELTRLARLAGGGEARVHERHGEHQRRGQRDDQPRLALAGRVHRFPVWRLRRRGDVAPSVRARWEP